MIDVTSRIPTCNYSKDRKGYRPEAIVLHITGDSDRGQTLSWFESSESGVSAHYVIEKDGTVYMCVDPSYRAYHCGIVNKPTAQIYFDKGNVNPNSYTIGIECVSSGEPLTNEQLKTLANLVKDLCNSFKIPLDRYHIIGHNELDSVDRAYDPVSSYHVEYVLNLIGGNNMDNNTQETQKHWAQDSFDYLNNNGVTINETRFDNKISRAEIFVLLAQIVKEIKK